MVASVPAVATVPSANLRSTPNRSISGIVTTPTIVQAAIPEPEAAPKQPPLRQLRAKSLLDNALTTFVSL